MNSYTRPALCPAFPSHTVAALYISDFVVTLLAFLGLLSGVDEIPNIYPPTMRKLAAGLGGGLLLWYLIIHSFTPAGLLPGFWGAFLPSLLLWTVGAALPLPLSPLFQNVLRSTPQAWLTGLHTLRVTTFLLLPLSDQGLLPLAYAATAGWGGLLVGITAPIVAYALGTKYSHGRQICLIWNLVGVAEILLSAAFGAAFLTPFAEARIKKRLPVNYLWYTVLLLPRYTYPFLLLIHGYSLYKLYTEKEDRSPMLWADDDDREELRHIYDIDSPGPQDNALGEEK